MEAFQTSAFSLKALAAALAPLMPAGSGIVGMDFDARVAWPIYDWMGVAKAALESVSRYLARDLGPQGIRVNLVSAGPLGTVAARGIPGFEQLADLWRAQAPLGLGHRRSGARSRARSAGCCRITRRRSPARSCTSTAAFTRSARPASSDAAPARANGTGPARAAHECLRARPVVVGHVAPGAADQDRRLHRRPWCAPDRRPTRARLRPRSTSRAARGRGCRAPAPVVERPQAGAADRDVALAVSPGTAERVGDQDRRRRAEQAR